MRFTTGGLLNFLKIRQNKPVPEIRQLGISQRYRSSSNGHNNNSREENKSSSFVGTGGAVKRGLIILSAVGLSGFLLLKKSLFRKANCDEGPKKGKDVESYRNPDNFVTGDICFKEAIKKSKGLLERIRREHNCPAITISVSVDGKELWSEGIGLCDVENKVGCSKKSVFRIASISKSVTMAIVAKLVEEGRLDLDLPVQHYVPDWPDKFFNGKKVDITTRQLVSMLSGIRHYDKDCSRPSKEKKKRREYDMKEFHLNKRFGSVSESLNLFKNDELCSMPGTEFLYSTHTWTLISAVIEKVVGKKIEEIFYDLFKELNLNDTHLDINSAILPNRARYYNVGKSGKLQNAPTVDNSYKWAGGGLQSTSSDICKFGTTMLSFYQGLHFNAAEFKVRDLLGKNVPEETASASPRKPYLSPSTMKMIWTPVEKTKCTWDRDGFYAMGWCSVPERPLLAPQMEPGTEIDYRRSQYFSHTGGATGASSVLLVMPRNEQDTDGNKISKQAPKMPRGTVVAIITNMEKVSLNSTALEIAAIFETARSCHVKNKHNFLQYFMDEDNNVDSKLTLSLFYTHE